MTCLSDGVSGRCSRVVFACGKAISQKRGPDEAWLEEPESLESLEGQVTQGRLPWQSRLQPFQFFQALRRIKSKPPPADKQLLSIQRRP